MPTPVRARPSATASSAAARGKGRDDDGRRSGKLTLNQALSGGEGGRQRSMAAMKRKQERARQKAMGGSVEREKVVRDVNVPETIIVSELANRMAERVADVVKALMNKGMMVTQNQTIDADTAELIIEEFGHKVVRVSDADVEDVIAQVEDKPDDLQPRPPVITIMGHVDHGKTSLLDAIRKAKVVAGEAGGITQHIGAYQVTTDGGQLLTFLDTPGHAAFTSMRARGAQVTDIVVLVVAADDAVMPQTVEAINHAKAAKVPMIVAINKIDKPAANPDKVRTDLLQHEVVVEKMSGDVQDVEVSAITGQGLDELLEAIALQAEILELKANPNRAAQGAVIEAQLDVGRGPVATVLVQNGTLRQGDIFVVGEQWGKVRAHGERQGRAGDGSRPVGAGRGARPERHARSGRRSERGRDRGAGPRDRRIPRAGRPRTSAPPPVPPPRSSSCWPRPRPTRTSASCRSWSRPTCRALPRRSSRRWRRSATTRCACACCIPVSARSPRPMSAWPKPRARRSSASTSAPMRRRATPPTRRASRSATTR